MINNDSFRSGCLMLVSASARRARILAGLGVEFVRAVPIVEEEESTGSPSETAMHNAARKCEWGMSKFPDCFILAADTVIDFDGAVIGKPRDMEQARAFFSMFSGRTHDVVTGVAFRRPGNEPVVFHDRSSVEFIKLDCGDTAAYFSLVDPMDKAGGYDIDRESSLIIRCFRGSRSNIMGLPEERIIPLLSTAGLFR